MSDMYCLYQLKDIPENKKFLYQSYEYVISNGGAVIVNRYDKVYEGMLLTGMTASSVRQAINDKPRRAFSNRAPGVGDVITMDWAGETECYYLDDLGMVRIIGFFETEADGFSPLTPESVNVRIRNKPGLWQVADTLTVEDTVFFLLENTEFGRKAAGIITDAEGRIVWDNVVNDFDDEAVHRIKQFLHPEHPMPVSSNQVHEKPDPERYQLFYENGTYERSSSAEASEANYNMIDGQNNNAKSPEIRVSVRKRLRQKQALLHGKPADRDELTRRMDYA